MALRPPPTIELSAREAARLVDAAFPALAPARAIELGSGWDNAAFLVNGVWVFRFPRRAEAASLMENEVRIVPALARAMPVATSAPELVARGVAGFPYLFAGYRRIEGATACTLPDERDRAALAEPLAAALRALHAAAPDIDGEPPGDALRKADVAYRLEWLRELLRRDEGRAEARALLARAERFAEEAGACARPAWVHGDLYPRHLVVRRSLAGIIDWGDVHVGDPAIDLSVVYGWLPPRAEERFFAIYGDADEATRARARFRAIYYAAIFARHAAESGDAGFATMARIYAAQLFA